MNLEASNPHKRKTGAGLSFGCTLNILPVNWAEGSQKARVAPEQLPALGLELQQAPQGLVTLVFMRAPPC